MESYSCIGKFYSTNSFSRLFMIIRNTFISDENFIENHSRYVFILEEKEEYFLT